MKRKNIILYAGAALGVAVCGVFLSKELREMLFGALAHPPKGDEANEDRDQIRIDPDNTGGHDDGSVRKH